MVGVVEAGRAVGRGVLRPVGAPVRPGGRGVGGTDGGEQCGEGRGFADGDQVPDNLTAVAALRITHREVSLEALGQMMDPPMTKDAIAGRIRRLLALADRHARHTGIPDTTAALTMRENL